ncbi:MAG TPA: ThuA domain-containing protein, partial [Planctomycetota bacterium]|nr:ThuA domain-containing protein [Planctomycetota bacterium]
MKDSPRNRVSRHFLRAAPRQRPRLATSLGAAALFFGAAAALGGGLSQKGASAPRTPPDPPGARRILLIAGPITGHPKEAHEYEKSVVLFKRLLETSPNLRGARVEIHLGGWPADPSSLDSADTIVLISDGGDHKETDHPLYVGDRLAVLERSMRRGCGLVNLHWSTFHPARFHDRITEWLGGYFDYETGGGEPKWYSRIQHANWRVAPIAPAEGGAELHPILRGVRPFEMREEFYFRLRFRESDARLRPILAIAPTEPPGATITAGPQNENVVAWARERPDGGRAFGCTGGHYFANWWNPDFRKVILNAIAWTAKLDVPAEGVASEPFERFRALVVTGHNHPAHDWRAVTAALVQVLEADPRMQVDVTEQPNDLATIDLGAYALLVLNYCNWDRPGLSQPAQQALVRRLESGGGLAVVHFANGAFNSTLPAKDSDWEEFRTNIVRRVWMHGDGRSGHDAFGPFRVEIARADHEVTSGLPGFDTVDELYFRQEGSQPIEVLATAKSKATEKDEPMAWVHAYGRGRVFQTVLGHSDVSVRKAGDLMRRGATWAAGRPPLGFDPPMAAAETYLFREGSPWSPAESKAREGARGSNDAARTAPPALLAASPGLEAGLGGHWGVQSDKDWVDARWSQTDVGPFLASSIEVPGGFVTKALAIRVGDGGGGAVCFDTQSVGLRAAWTGTFLELPRVRFGITEKPRIAGKIVISTPPGAGWTVDGAPPSSSTVRYTGLHRHGRRVVLSCDVGGVELLESPWLETRGSIFAFRRSVEAASGSTALQCLVASLQGAAGQASPDGDGTTAILELGEEVTVVHATPREALTLRVRGEAIEAVLPARTAPRAGTIWLGSGPRASV